MRYTHLRAEDLVRDWVEDYKLEGVSQAYYQP
jgi:hypothetical protein